MKAALQNKNGLPAYKMTESYISGTAFHIYLSNDYPAYVYVISSDQTNNVTMQFPPNDRTSAALFGKTNEIALPDEDKDSLFYLDDEAGTTYALALFSLDPLPIDNIIQKIHDNRGSFAQKTKNAIGNDLIPFEEIKLERDKIKFSSKSSKKIMAVVVEIEHRDRNNKYKGKRGGD